MCGCTPLKLINRFLFFVDLLGGGRKVIFNLPTPPPPITIMFANIIACSLNVHFAELQVSLFIIYLLYFVTWVKIILGSFFQCRLVNVTLISVFAFSIHSIITILSILRATLNRRTYM